MRVKGIYKIPTLRHIFIVVPSSPIAKDSPKLLLQSKMRKEYFEQAVRSKDCTINEQNAKWTIRVIAEDDFLESIAGKDEMAKSLQTLPFENPESMELLAMNLLKTPAFSSDPLLRTPKVLSRVREEDIIEVFI